MLLYCGSDRLSRDLLTEANPARRLSVTMLAEQNQAQQVPLSAGREKEVRLSCWLRVPAGFRLLPRSAAHFPLVRAVSVDAAGQCSSKALFLQVDTGGRTPESDESHDNGILGELYVLNGEQGETAESAGVPVVGLHDGLEIECGNRGKERLVLGRPKG